MEFIHALTRRAGFRCFADYIYRSLSCGALLYVLIVVCQKIPLGELAKGWVIVAALAVGVAFTFLDAIGALYEASDGSVFLAALLGIVTFMFVSIIVFTAVA